MNKIPIKEGIKPICLIVSLLLSACHTAPLRPALNDLAIVGHVPADYIDPTKSLFPLGNYRYSVDKLLPPGSDIHVPLMDTAKQQRHFSDLKSRYFCMETGEKSPWGAFLHRISLE